MGGAQQSTLAREESAQIKGYDSLQVIPRGDPAWVEIDAMINERQKSYIGFYRHHVMKMSRLWRIRPQSGQQEEAKQKEAAFGLPEKLFHGTDVKSAEQILADGFQIPEFPGMFGRGIYFARCPLKSEMYARGTGVRGAGWAVQSAFRTLIRRKDEPTFTSRVMLLCDVYLGNSKCERCLLNVWCGCYQGIAAPEDIKPTFLDLVCCPHQCCYYCKSGGFQSVHAPGGRSTCLNTVKVTEYVVYDPCQAVPLYLVEFETEDSAEDKVVGRPVRTSHRQSTRSQNVVPLVSVASTHNSQRTSASAHSHRT